MNKRKICVYAICKNEEQFVERWMQAVSEADMVVVLDTGSTDHTVEKLTQAGAVVYQEIIDPWRFDVARNRSLEKVPADMEICVCVDLDEHFEPGWRQKLEDAWQEDTTQASYRYSWNFREDGSEGYVFWIEKIHKNGCFRWIHPVHEVLAYTGSIPPVLIQVEGIQLNHHADPSKSRSQYLPLLELAVQESPEDDRNMHYLGREYMYRGRWDDCINTLQHHLQMPAARWRDERCASMRYIARAYEQKGERQQAKCWLYRAIAEAPHLREPYVDMAGLLYRMEEWEGVIAMTAGATGIQQRPRTYICEADAWGSLPYDLASIAYYHTGQYQKALEAAQQAMVYSPNDQRLQNNVILMKGKIGKAMPVTI